MSSSNSGISLIAPGFNAAINRCRVSNSAINNAASPDTCVCSIIFGCDVTVHYLSVSNGSAIDLSCTDTGIGTPA
ncbi:hypothetical protein ACTL6P_14555 [Endozoicomonas acroporae]|uniref:hypothetical protein n=1 Tax=Endozoicomonas acroporae TaxID=1701104 RepID=UPI003F8CC24A